MKRAALIVAVVLLGLPAVLLVGADPATASVVYVKEGNVWLANADGSGPYQVTLDGSASSPYVSPSQADDGTIVAARAQRLYRMRQNGDLLNPPFGTASPLGGIVNPRISPDGSRIGFYFVTAVCCPISTRTATLYSYADRYTDPGVFGRQDSFRFASWIGNGRALGHFGTQANFDDVGGGDNSYTDWFYESDYGADPTVNLNDGEVSPQRNRIAVVRADDQNGAGGVIWLYRAAAIVPRGQPSATPTPVCQISGDGGAWVRYHRPSWSPDGLQLAWDEPDGIHLAQIPAAALGGSGENCGQITDRLVLPGATAPDLGPANVAPGPRGGGEPSPGGGDGPDPGGKTGRGGGSRGALVRPVLSGLTISPSTFRALRSNGSIAGARGAAVRYSLSVPAVTRFRVERRAPGRRVGGRCVVVPSPRRRPARRCIRYERVRRSFRRPGAAGPNAFRFTGRIGARKLAPGRYRLVAVATDAAAGTSAPARRAFRIAG